MTKVNQSVLSSLASEDEEERHDDDDVVSDDDGLFPSIMIITLFSAAGVSSTRKLEINIKFFELISVFQPFKVSPSELLRVALLFFNVGLRGCITLEVLQCNAFSMHYFIIQHSYL